MNNSLYSCELFKIAHKSWQYVISDEVVYAIQYGNVIIGRSQGGYLDYYLKGNGWIEFFHYPIFVDSGRSYAWVAIMERNLHLGRPLDNRHKNTLWRDNEAMLSLIGDFSQDGQEVCFRPLSSVIRLKVFEIGDGEWKNISKLLADLIFEPTPGLPWTIANGKLCLMTGCAGSSQVLDCQLPSAIVNTSSQAISNIKSNLSPNIRDGRRPYIFNFPFILLGSHSEGVNLIVGDSSFQGIEVSFRPVTLQPTVIQYMRRWYTFHEQKISKDTKDSKRTRNSHTNTRRVRTKSKKGNNPRQITTSQPEEVTPQTSPDHHHGDYNAKNTHLGSPEDV
jgi:hypothetical protein